MLDPEPQFELFYMIQHPYGCARADRDRGYAVQSVDGARLPATERSFAIVSPICASFVFVHDN